MTARPVQRLLHWVQVVLIDSCVLQTAWVQRKRIVVDAVNQIADGMEKKPAAVNELCGIETDADVGVKEIPTI